MSRTYAEAVLRDAIKTLRELAHEIRNTGPHSEFAGESPEYITGLAVGLRGAASFIEKHYLDPPNPPPRKRLRLVINNDPT